MLKPVPGGLVALALLASIPATPPAPPPPPHFCEARILRDYDFQFSYFAVFRLAKTCPPGGVARIRKSSTLSTRENGAPYQPIRPEVGAWNLNEAGSNVPLSARWTLNTWRWDYWDGAAWQPMKSARHGGGA